MHFPSKAFVIPFRRTALLALPSMLVAVMFAATGAAPALAQTTAAAPTTAAAKPAARKPQSKVGVNPKLAHSAQKAVEEVTPVDDDPSITLGDTELAIARQIYVGEIPCELGASVKLTPGRRVGFFVVTTKGHRFLMHPVESRTGAIRLEDARAGALWLQLGNKSMLMSQKLGQRLADECQSPEQVTLAEKLKTNPAPSLLDPAAAAPAAKAAAAVLDAPSGQPATRPAN